MNRYIDAEWLTNTLKSRGNVLIDSLDSAPSIDIVRCKDCKYWKESQYYPEFMVCTYVKGATFTRQHDDFCSRGERSRR